MSKRTTELVSRLETAIGSDDFIDACDDVVEELLKADDAPDAILQILRLMELNEGVDFGMPGPLVHFVERYYQVGYEDQLLASIARKATPHTLWMLNRITNGAEGELKSKCLQAMRVAVGNNDLSELARSTAKDFVEYQST
jgi:hypothetical protein